MEIIDLLIANGLNNVVLVGDPEQAIFEWNDAKPNLFNDKYEKWEKNSIILDTNFRSSNSICRFISKLSDLDDINSGSSIEDISPTIICYSNNLDEVLLILFLNDCCSHRENVYNFITLFSKLRLVKLKILLISMKVRMWLFVVGILLVMLVKN